MARNDIPQGIPLNSGYCHVHEYTVALYRDENDELYHWHYVSQEPGNNEVVACYGGFTDVPLPLTDEQWEQLFEMEESIYGTENII